MAVNITISNETITYIINKSYSCVSANINNCVAYCDYNLLLSIVLLNIFLFYFYNYYDKLTHEIFKYKGDKSCLITLGIFLNISIFLWVILLKIIY